MPAPTPISEQAKTVVLAVDDDPLLQALAQRILSDAGFEVLFAPDATVALDILRRRRVDVLLTDIVMPGPLSGVDLAREAKALNPKLKIVATTAYASALDVGLPMLVKPYLPKQLVEAITRSLAA